MSKSIWTILVAVASLLAADPTRAVDIRIARQYGIPYLPLIVMEHERLVEKRLEKLGVSDAKVVWLQLSSENAMNDALISGNLDFGSGGPTGLIVAWDKTQKYPFAIKAVATMNEMPLYLVSLDPRIKTIKDFTSKDRIAAATAKGGFQYTIAQMAAEKILGRYDALDNYFVAMPHPDAVNLLLSGQIAAHFGSPPFQYQELEDPRAHIVLNSDDVLGGATSISIFISTKQFHDNNPKLFQAVYEALDDATAFINADLTRAASIYVESDRTKKLTVGFVKKIITDPKVKFTTTPNSMMQFANFMYRVGLIKTQPSSWKDLFFPEIYGKQGS
jgi:NitT/TauT family transport system substrate-binding protein